MLFLLIILMLLSRQFIDVERNENCHVDDDCCHEIIDSECYELKTEAVFCCFDIVDSSSCCVDIISLAKQLPLRLYNQKQLLFKKSILYILTNDSIKCSFDQRLRLKIIVFQLVIIIHQFKLSAAIISYYF